MAMNKEYSISFSGLKQGKHSFKYKLDRKFFEDFGYSDFNEADIDLEVILNRMNNMLELDLNASGSLNVNCDITQEPYDHPVVANLELVVKFGEEFNDEDDDILIIPHGEHQVNIAQYIYEMMVLAAPVKRVHPGVLDGSLKSEMLDKLEELRPQENRRKQEETDPRWDILKKLKSDN